MFTLIALIPMIIVNEVRLRKDLEMYGYARSDNLPEWVQAWFYLSLFVDFICCIVIAIVIGIMNH